MKILNIQSSVTGNQSVSRKVSKVLVEKLLNNGELVCRDLNQGLPFISGEMMQAFQTKETERTAEQQKLVTVSDELIKEFIEADAVVIGVPLYNFCIPAVLKAYIDLITRAGVTFNYTENGPVGLLKDKPLYLVFSSGGVKQMGQGDFATPLMQQLFGFLGIKQIHLITADQTMIRGEEAIQSAMSQIQKL